MSIENNFNSKKEDSALYEHFQNGPYAPEGSRGMLEHKSFSSIKETLTNQEMDRAIEFIGTIEKEIPKLIRKAKKIIR